MGDVRLLPAALAAALSLTGCASTGPPPRPASTTVAGAAVSAPFYREWWQETGTPGRERDQRIHRPGRGGRIPGRRHLSCPGPVGPRPREMGPRAHGPRRRAGSSWGARGTYRANAAFRAGRRPGISTVAGSG